MADSKQPSKPSSKAPVPASKAPSKAAVGVAELATKLGTDPRALRKFIRVQGIGVGRGSRYSWPSMASAEVKRIVTAWEGQGE
jgi:hypothetical protein